MNISLKLAGEICLEMDQSIDWVRVEYLIMDASKPETPLAETLATRMKHGEDDWKEYVIPDLTNQFSEQIRFVYSEIEKARSKQSEKSQLIITKEGTDQWYGTLNQARLYLEAEYTLSELGFANQEQYDALDEDIQFALVRADFYTLLQSTILEHLMG